MLRYCAGGLRRSRQGGAGRIGDANPPAADSPSNRGQDHRRCRRKDRQASSEDAQSHATVSPAPPSRVSARACIHDAPTHDSAAALSAKPTCAGGTWHNAVRPSGISASAPKKRRGAARQQFDQRRRRQTGPDHEAASSVRYRGRLTPPSQQQAHADGQSSGGRNVGDPVAGATCGRCRAAGATGDAGAETSPLDAVR